MEGIFRLSGSAKRIKDLQQIFNTPDRYGKGLDWTGYNVHDAANILRRYLNQLPEPIVPLESYERFRQPLRAYQANGQRNTQSEAMEAEEHSKTVRAYQQLITELPPLNRQLLLYILDLLAVFASKSDLNRMNAQNLAAIFQPGIISHPKDDMAPSEYRLSQDVLIFLIENQDHFLIGMSGTAMDDKAKDEVKSTAPSIANQTTGTVDRSTSNASAGADSLRKTGGVRRNASLSSHNSRDRASPNVSTPGTPASPANLTSTGSTGGLGRSNTVPSNRSPAMPGTARFQRITDASQAASPMSAHANSVGGPTPDELLEQQTPTVPGTDIRAPSREVSAHPQEPRLAPTAIPNQMSESPASASAGQELRPIQDNLSVAPLDIKSSTRDRKISNLLNMSPMFGPTDSSKDPNARQPRKLQKRRIPGSSIESAQSSQASLNADDTSAFQTPLATPNPMVLDRGNPVDHQAVQAQHPHSRQATPERLVDPAATSPTGPREVRNVSGGLMPPQSPTPSIHSRGSATDPSDLDALEDPLARTEKKRHRFTLSRADPTPLAPPPIIGQHAGARTSNSSLGSNRPRKSFTGESQTTQTSMFDASNASYPSAVNVSSRESSEMYKEHNDPIGKGFFGKIKAKFNQSRADERERAKSPPRLQADHGSRSSLSAFTQEHLSPRGRSFDKPREGSLGVVDERPGHQRTGSRTPVPPPASQWPQGVSGPAPTSAATPASAVYPPPGSISAPASAAPVDPALMPAPLQRRSQQVEDFPSDVIAPLQGSRTVPILASETAPASMAANSPEVLSKAQQPEVEAVPVESQNAASTVEPTSIPVRTSIHDQVAPLIMKSNTVPVNEQMITTTPQMPDPEATPKPAPVTTDPIAQPQQHNS